MVIYRQSKNVEFHTKLSDILPKMDGYHLPLTWMLSDLDCNLFPDLLQGEEPFLLSGQQLVDMMQTDPHLQVIWGVLSGFRLPIVEIDTTILPISENAKVWDEEYQIQHPQAECELLAWDSSATFFRSKSRRAMRTFAESFPEAQNLSEFNPDRS